MLPQPLADLPLIPETDESLSPQVQTDDNPGATSDPSLSSAAPRTRKPFTSLRNIFGLFRRYHSETWPTHDPEEFVDLQALSDIPVPEFQCSNSNTSDADASRFRPYGNESSFRLGNWYWSNGVQKTRSNFRKLIDIIAHPSFKPKDVGDAKWDQIDKELAGNSFNSSKATGSDGEGEGE